MAVIKEEVSVLKSYKFDDVALSAIEKTVRDTILGAFHDAFALLDAVRDPEIVEVDETWLGLKLSEPNEEEENEEFLHDGVMMPIGIGWSRVMMMKMKMNNI